MKKVLVIVVAGLFAFSLTGIAMAEDTAVTGKTIVCPPSVNIDFHINPIPAGGWWDLVIGGHVLNITSLQVVGGHLRCIYGVVSANTIYDELIQDAPFGYSCGADNDKKEFRCQKSTVPAASWPQKNAPKPIGGK
jgi:hypothetical protein